uniref:hypothetical protein n=1 Tax=Paractinoplanes polyasparticus TaxID=2856853 RepID=UPI001C85C387|nr:hypothetical protein [Actinoplanes polyasparticus]
MATGEVGTFDEKTPPTRETFGDYPTWTTLTPYVEDLIDLGKNPAVEWYHGGDAWTASLGSLENMVQDLLDLTSDLTSGDEPFFAGEAADAFVEHVNKTVEKSRTGVQDVIRSANFGAAVYGVGTSIDNFRSEFWAIVDAGHRLTDKLEQYASDQIDAIYSGIEGADAQRETDRREAMDAAYQAGERWIMSNLRSLLVQQSQQYRDTGLSLPQLTVGVQENVKSDGTGDSGTGDSGDGDEGSGGEGDEGSGGEGDEGSGSEGDGDEGSGSEGDGDEGSGSEGSGSEGTGGSGTSDDGVNDVLDEAEGRVDDAIAGLGNGDPEHDAALDEARDAAGAVFDDLRQDTDGGQAPPETFGTGGTGGTSGGGNIPPVESVAPEASTGAPGPGSVSAPTGSPGSGSGSGSSGGAPPDGGAARDQALKDAQVAANDAIGGLMEGTPASGGSDLPGGTGSTPPIGLGPAMNGAPPVGSPGSSGLGSPKSSVPGSPGAAVEQERQRALDDAKDAAAKAIDGLTGGSGGPPGTTDLPATTSEDPAGSQSAADDQFRRPLGEEALIEGVPSSPGVAPDGDSVPGSPGVAPDGDSVPGSPGVAPDGDSVPGSPGVAPDGLGDDRPAGDRSAEEQAARDDALADARKAADDAIDGLLDDDAMAEGLDSNGDGRPDGDLNRDGKIDTDEAEALRDDALADADKAIASSLDDMIEDTKAETGRDDLTDEERQSRIDALTEAKESAGRAVDDLVAENGDHSSMSDFLHGRREIPAGDPGGGVAPRGDIPGGDPEQRAPLELAPVTGANAAVSSAEVPLSSGTPAGNGGMPMSPPMGGGMSPQGDRDRERNTWLVGEDGMWGEDVEDVVASRPLGRN